MEKLGPGQVSRRLSACTTTSEVLDVLAQAGTAVAPGGIAVATVSDATTHSWRVAVSGAEGAPHSASLAASLAGPSDGHRFTPPDLEAFAHASGRDLLQTSLTGAAGVAPGTLALLLPPESPAGEAEHALLAELADLAAVGRLALRAVCATDRLATVEHEQREQQKFLSIAAHDLRTPLAAIRGYAQLLLRQRGTEMAPQQSSGLQTIVQQADRLAALTETILDVARIQTRRMALRRVSADLGQIVRDATHILGSQPGTPPIRLSLPPTGPVLQADVARLGQITRGLLEFAVARTADSEAVVVRVAAEDGGVRLSVDDPGPILPERDRVSLFTRLIDEGQEGSSPSLAYLSLYIAGGVAAAHGGRIWADSPVPEREVGARLSVWLPSAA